MIGIFGGTFDPIHLGHLGLARAVCQSVALDRLIFVPLGTPPHRESPQASSKQRVDFLRVALAEEDGFEVSTVEIDKPSPSWTVETLVYFRQSLPKETLCLLMGSDAFKSINQWHRWQSLLDYCHIIVVSRQGDEADLSDEVAEYLAQHHVQGLSAKDSAQQGGILWLEADVPEISSTQIRQCIVQGGDLKQLVPDAVASMIKEEKYYG